MRRMRSSTYSMLEKRHEHLEEEDLEEKEEERKGKEKPKEDNFEIDPEERRRLFRQGRSGGEGHIVEYLHSLKS